MRILVISQYFYPENFRINDLCLSLKKRGHKISVLTGKPNYPKGEYFEGYSWNTKSFETIKGIDVYRSNLFLRKNSNKKIVVLDIPLLIENKLNTKKDILVFVDSKKSQINSRLKKRKNYNKKILENLRKLQINLSYKKKLSTYTIKNDFKLLTIKKRVKFIKDKILYERNSSRH